MSVRRSASGAGVSPAEWIFALRKASIGLADPAGTAGDFGDSNAHHLPLVHAAPWSIQSISVLTSSAVRDALGGIFRSPSRAMARNRRLSADLPGMMAGPRLPPLRRLSRELILRPETPFDSPWQAAHLC